MILLAANSFTTHSLSIASEWAQPFQIFPIVSHKPWCCLAHQPITRGGTWNRGDPAAALTSSWMNSTLIPSLCPLDLPPSLWSICWSETYRASWMCQQELLSSQSIHKHMVLGSHSLVHGSRTLWLRYCPRTLGWLAWWAVLRSADDGHMDVLRSI